jgi:hypothetical protein
MNLIPTLIPDTQTTTSVQPGKGAFNNPAMRTQAHSLVNASSSKSGNNSSFYQSLSMFVAIIASVRMQLFRTTSELPIGSRQRWYCIDHLQKHRNITHIGTCVPYGEWDSSSVDHNMALRARFAAIRWIRTGFFAPPGAGTLPESMLARDQSIWSALDNRSNMARWSCSHKPASCQSRNRLQQVIPLPHPISGGSISHGIPVFNTNRIPVSATRSLRRGRPPFGLGGTAGSRGSMICHNSSVTKGFVMPLFYRNLGFVRGSKGFGNL